MRNTRVTNAFRLIAKNAVRFYNEGLHPKEYAEHINDVVPGIDGIEYGFDDFGQACMSFIFMEEAREDQVSISVVHVVRGKIGRSSYATCAIHSDLGYAGLWTYELEGNSSLATYWRNKKSPVLRP